MHMKRLGLPPAAYTAHIRQLTQEWLQQLALLLQPVRQAPRTPNYIRLSVLTQQLPMPSLVAQHFGGVVRAVDAFPELQ